MKFNLKESTLKTWKKSLLNYGKLLLEQLIENYNLKKELEIKADKLSKLQSLLEEQLCFYVIFNMITVEKFQALFFF